MGLNLVGEFAFEIDDKRSLSHLYNKSKCLGNYNSIQM